MKHSILAIGLASAVVASGCMFASEEAAGCGQSVQASVIGYAKDGAPYYDDQTPLPIPCLPALPNSTAKVPITTILVPLVPVITIVEDVVMVRKNNGCGNGDQDAPGNSETHNAAENKGGNGNGRKGCPTGSWH